MSSFVHLPCVSWSQLCTSALHYSYLFAHQAAGHLAWCRLCRSAFPAFRRTESTGFFWTAEGWRMHSLPFISGRPTIPGHPNLKGNKLPAPKKRIWCSGIIVPSHGTDRGSIPRMRNRFCRIFLPFFLYWFSSLRFSMNAFKQSAIFWFVLILFSSTCLFPIFVSEHSALLCPKNLILPIVF